MKLSLRFSVSRGRHARSRLRPRPGLRLALTGVLLSTLLALLAAPASTLEAQVREGISLGVTPTAERIFWSDDLALEDSWYYGGRASLNFGRFVALQGYYLTGDDVEVAGTGELEDALRYGGDVVFTFARWALTPFVSAGAGVSEFEVADGGESEILTGTAAAGIRFDLFDRFQTQLFAQDVLFRASSGSPLVDAGAIDEGENETFHNLSVGAGINFYLGGQSGQTETDRSFQDGLHGVASPLELYGGEIRWDNALAIEDLTVGGARLGVDFGPYVGLRGYYFGSVENEFDDFTDYMGYGAEGRFNLTRSDEAFTPFLVLGGGRVHFPDSVAAAAGFDDDKKWNAVLGGGVGFNVTERLRLEAAARDVLLSRSEPEAVTAPDQLHHSWMFTGGLRFSLGGDTDEPPRPEPRFPERPGERAAADRDAAEDSVRAAGARAAARREQERQTEQAHQIRALRAEVDSLRSEVRGEPPGGFRAAVDTSAAAETAPDAMRADRRGDRDPRLFELPVLEDGEIYIRFGESGTFQRPAEAGDEGDAAELRRLMMLQRMRQLRREADTTPEAAQRDSVRAMMRDLQAEMDSLEAAGAARRPAPNRGAPAGGAGAGQPADSLREELDRLRTRLDSLRAADAQEEQARRLERMESSLLQRMETLQEEIERLERGEGEDADRVRVEVEGDEMAGTEDVTVEGARQPRGVLRGDPLGIHRISPYAGASLHEPNQLLLGVKADVGSAFGGGARVVPELTFGVTDDFTWNANAHIEWPIPLDLERLRPYVGGGIGILDNGENGETELLIPNVVAGATYPVGRYEVFGTLQGLDFFDDTRLVFGLHTRPPGFLGSDDPEPAARVRPERAGPGRARTGLTAAEDSARIAERVRLEAEYRQLDSERRELRSRLEAAGGEAAEDRRPGREAGESDGEALRRELADLRGAPAVSDVRRTDRGASLVLGGASVFRSGSAELSGGARATISRLAAALVRRPEVRVLVEGHTDAQGPASLNERLSRRRAESVAAALAASGVEPGRISAVGYGESRPIAENATAEGRAENRRVEVVLVLPR